MQRCDSVRFSRFNLEALHSAIALVGDIKGITLGVDAHIRRCQQLAVVGTFFADDVEKVSGGTENLYSVIERIQNVNFVVLVYSYSPRYIELPWIRAFGAEVAHEQTGFSEVGYARESIVDAIDLIQPVHGQTARQLHLPGTVTLGAQLSQPGAHIRLKDLQHRLNQLLCPSSRSRCRARF